jgi:hypothetical protein
MDAKELFDLALAKKVAFVIGSAFHCDGKGQNTLRLNFSYPEPEAIHTAISRLGEALRGMMEKRGDQVAAPGREFEKEVLVDGDHALTHLPLNLAIHEILE